MSLLEGLNSVYCKDSEGDKQYSAVQITFTKQKKDNYKQQYRNNQDRCGEKKQTEGKKWTKNKVQSLLQQSVSCLPHRLLINAPLTSLAY